MSTLAPCTPSVNKIPHILSPYIQIGPARTGMETKQKQKQKSLIDPDSPKLKTDLDQTMEIDSVPFHNLSLGHDGQKMEEPVEVTQSLVLPPTDMTNVEGVAKDEPGEEEKKHMEMELRLQKEEERYDLYNRVYIGQFSEEEVTDTETDNLSYSYFSYEITCNND